MIRDHAQGCVVSVRAQPGAKRNSVVGVHGDALKIAVQAPADQGKANAALVELLAEVLGVRRQQVELLTGQTSRDKSLLIRGLSAEAARAKLAAASA